MTHPLRCETCKFFDETTKRYCTCQKIKRQIDGEDIVLIGKLGCASHSDAGKVREKVLDKLCKICPFLDERPETCENCVVETVRKELRKGEK